MSYDPIDALGLSCPSGGNFYVCKDSKIKFLGCCDVDPCGEVGGGWCPPSALHAAAFDTVVYYKILEQGCVEAAEDHKWYTCIGGGTFMGCCASDPCGKGVCPKGDLWASALSTDPKNASVFIATTATSSTTQDVMLPTSPIPSPDPNDQRSSSTPIGGIVGGVLGGLVVLGLIAFFLFRRRRRRRAFTVAPSDEHEVVMSRLPESPYYDSFRHSPILPPAPVSPLTIASAHRRSLSASLSSIIGFARTGARKHRTSQASTDSTASRDRGNGQGSPGFLNPVAELESPPAGGMLVRGPLHDSVYFEVEGSTPAARLAGMGMNTGTGRGG